MALPNPIPDNPLKWDGWKHYNSPNLYDRLGLSFSANATAEMIEDHCRQMLVWWQKKLPLKNQPSNPMAQLLRQGLDEAPHFLADARSKLLNPEERKRIDAELHVRIVETAVVEFKKLVGFTLADKRLTRESEEKLLVAGERLGLTKADMDPVINAELVNLGGVRVADEPPAPPPVPIAAAAAVTAPGVEAKSPADEFRRILKMSRLCLDGDEMSDDQRDAMCNLGESLGLTGGESEDLIDEYLEEMASKPMVPQSAPVPSRVARSATPAASAKPAVIQRPAVQAPVRPAAPAVQVKKELAQEVDFTPAARAIERQRYHNFTNANGVEMLLIPSGRFQMGSAESFAQQNEQPPTPVVLSCFHLSRYPITNAQYEAFDPGHASRRGPWADDRHPVIYVNWNDAQAFCKWLSAQDRKSYRLPTEAEWEYAARGDEGRTYPWGEWTTLGQFANFADARTNFPWRDVTIDDGFAETAPVGSFPRGASPFGIEDMAGNVFEWCLDTYEAYKGKELVNPRIANAGRHRVYRGGSWKSRPSSLRTTARAFNEPGYSSSDIGFRIVCECA